jgi:DNA-binding NtrC family response regulator
MKRAADNLNVLLIEDNDTMREGMVRVIEKLGYPVTQAADTRDSYARLSETSFRLVISDYKLPDGTGMQILGHIKEKYPDTEVLLITAYGSVDLAVEAMQKGAADFITKPFSPEELTLRINKVVEQISSHQEIRRLSDENLLLREHVEDQFNYGEIIGRSDQMQNIFKTISKVAKNDSSIIIYGASGTGKELVARAIHKASARHSRPFVRVNCGALAENLLESELFGHEKGAFTGASKLKKGRFELADQGTIFLDEIGDISPATQIKLLRVLQEKEFERVGGEVTIKIDVRIIAATNKNLQQAIREGSFREDLYYRLHIIPITLPPLKDRKADIPLLADHFIKKMRRELQMANLSLDDKALDKLMGYDWPGNIREFENVIERAAVLCDDACIRSPDLPVFGSVPSVADSPDSMDLTTTLENVEKDLLEKAMGKTHGVKTEAAKLLGIKTSALYYKLEKYNLI